MGGGIEHLDQSVRPTSSLIPSDCTWFKTKVVEFNPEKNIIVTADGNEVEVQCSFNSLILLVLQ